MLNVHKIRSLLPVRLFEFLSSVRGACLRKVPNAGVYLSHIKNKNGIEIGGPSSLFKYRLPVYNNLQNLDGVNFSGATVWEGSIKEGKTYNFFKNKTGTQFISDGTELSQIGDGAYEFLLSSNCLEHIANPLKALHEWHRILKNKGVIILVLPNKASNFDHSRPVTSFQHILDDYHNCTTEYDLTHFDEIMELHDLSRDPPAGNLENFRNRSLDNFNNRTLHHHVFDLELMSSLLRYVGFECLHQQETRTDFFCLATKVVR